MSNLLLAFGMTLAGALAVKFTDMGSHYWRRVWISPSLERLRRAEESVLKNVRYQQRFVRAGDHDINTIIIEPADPTFASKPPLVLMAGWGGSAGMWMRNLNELAAQQRVIAIDVLGTGRSSRPRFTPRGPAETEEWFIDSLEQWRQEMNIDQMNLCGHSLGGYIAATYGMRFPHRLSSLVLASPAGVPEADPEVMEQRRQARLNGGFWRKNFVKFAEWCWHKEITLMDLIKFFGPVGDRMVNWVIRKRFSHTLDADEQRALGDYLYHSWVQESSGEQALYQIMGPWVMAKEPLVKRLHNIPPSVPILALYGEHDWMQKEPTEELASSAMPHLKVATLPKCGHQLFIENPPAFNSAVNTFCGSIAARK